MNRKLFLQQTGLVTAGLLVNNWSFAAPPDFPVVRVAENQRHFKSKAIDQAIRDFNRNVPDKELGWLFENCFPNTLDTTVYHDQLNGKPDTYVITGDIDAMWLRDSTAQV